MNIALFFGSFNPIHVGHLIIANTMVEYAEVDQLWFVVSPQNPFKQQKDLAHEFDRLDMVRLAIAENPKFNATDIEFRMPKPSYTVDTLAYLSDKYPQHQFKLVIGEDNLKHFHKWKNYKQVLAHHALLVYPRPGGGKKQMPDKGDIQLIEAPKIDISATFIRRTVKAGKSVRYLVHDDVAAYIRGKHLYER